MSNSTIPEDVMMHPGFVSSAGLIGGFLAIANVMWLLMALRKKPRSAGDDEVSKKMENIAEIVQKGAKSFLTTEYTYLAGFVFVVFWVLFAMFGAVKDGDDMHSDSLISGTIYAFAFLTGAILSALAGWIGMIVATDVNVKTTHAASASGMNEALQVAFAGGSVMGFTVVGLGIWGISVLFCLFTLGDLKEEFVGDDQAIFNGSFKYLAGFGFGASSIALFARVAGGIYTKAADVGADLVGKVEEDLPEDDPRNPAVIADNVGDNVGDVAGMGADLFESYVGSIIACGTLAETVQQQAFPFFIAGAGIVAALVGSKCICTKEGAGQKALLHSLNTGLMVAGVLSLGLVAIFVWMLGETVLWEHYGCMVIGLIAGFLIGEATEQATSYAYEPTKSIAGAGKTGSATVIIQGLGVGMLSTLPPVIIIVITIVACDALAGGYGIAVAAVGMLSTLGVSLATDAYGPIADNAGGIAEMAGCGEEVRSITDALDALGNTTAATGKGFAIGSAVLTSLSLMTSFKAASLGEDSVVDVTEPVVLGGVLFGAMLPYLFAALTMLSVKRAAEQIILEVRRQFKNEPGLKDLARTDLTPDYEACINISTKSSIEEMILPGVFAILMPVTIAFLVGPKCLLGLLTGSISSGCMLAIMMSNAGGAWDNAKKYVEIELKAKNSEEHKACVVGDTVGDPFKDTSGPALNILIKLMSMVSLVIAPLTQPENWATAPYGLIPLALMIISSVVVYLMYWKGYEDKIRAKHAEFDGTATSAPAPAAEEKPASSPEEVELVEKKE